MLGSLEAKILPTSLWAPAAAAASARAASSRRRPGPPRAALDIEGRLAHSVVVVVPLGVEARLGPTDQRAVALCDDDEIVLDPWGRVLGPGETGLEGGDAVLDPLVEDLRERLGVARLGRANGEWRAFGSFHVSFIALADAH